MEHFLRDLDADIISIKGRPNKKDCLVFICPICSNSHSILASWKPPSLFSSGAVWKKTGETIDNITLKPSINCDVPWIDEKKIEHGSSCKFHGYVKNGKVIW